jgi:hypothetical protein
MFCFFYHEEHEETQRFLYQHTKSKFFMNKKLSVGITSS